MSDRSVLSAILRDCEEGRTPPNIALFHLLTAAASEAQAREAVSCYSGTADEAGRLDELQELWHATPNAFTKVNSVCALASGNPSDVSAWAAVFDSAAAIDPDAAVALYAFGDPTLLRQATDELVVLMTSWNLLRGNSRVVDFGCGTGRIAAAIAPLVLSVTGLDVSMRMVQLARTATEQCGNVVIMHSASGDLEPLPSGSFEAVLSVDSMPYVVESGLAVRAFQDVARVLVCGGDWLIMNYSYRVDVAQDREDVENLAKRFGFAVKRNGTTDLELWDGHAFLLRKV